MVFCFLIFYLFMTAWMAVHMYVMVYNMPDLVVYTQHGMELGEPRNTRFNVDGLYLANHVGDDVIDLVSAPWDAARSDKYNLDSRYVVCNTGKFCSSSQQLRTLNQFRNRWLSADLPAQCYVKEVRVDGTVTTSDQANLTVSFSSFTDPYNASRTFENAATHVQMCKKTEPFKFGPGRENANAGVYPENCPQKLVRADGTNEWQGTLDSKLPYTHSYGEEDNALPWDNTTQPIAWLENSNLPHIVQYNVSLGLRPRPCVRSVFNLRATKTLSVQQHARAPAESAAQLPQKRPPCLHVSLIVCLHAWTHFPCALSSLPLSYSLTSR